MSSSIRERSGRLPPCVQSRGLVEISDDRRSRRVSTDARRYMQRVFLRTISAHSGVMTVPPPSARTTNGAHCLLCTVFRISLSTSVSRRRKATSPSEEKISGMLLPAASSIASSRSIKGQQSNCESSLPTLLLPHPINPVIDMII